MKPAAEKMYARRPLTCDTPVRAGVGVILLDNGGRILLERCSDCNKWALPEVVPPAAGSLRDSFAGRTGVIR